MRAPSSMEAVFDTDGASVRVSSAAPTPSHRASRLRQPTLRWVEPSRVPEMHSSSDIPMPIRKAALLPSPTSSPILESIEMPLFMAITMGDEHDNHELSTVAYDEDLSANKLQSSAHRGGDYLESCSAFKHSRGSINCDGGGGPAAHLIPAPPHHPRLSKTLQQEPRPQLVSPAPPAAPVAAIALPHGSSEAATAASKLNASGGSLCYSQALAGDASITTRLSFRDGRCARKGSDESELASQRLSRRPRDLPSFRPTPIALPFYTAGSERQCMLPATPVAAPPSGSGSARSLALEHGSRRFSNRTHPQQKQQRRRRNSNGSMEDGNAAASVTNSILTTLTSATGILASVCELPVLPLQSNQEAPDPAGKCPSTVFSGCLYVSQSSLALSSPSPSLCTRGADVQAALASSPARSCVQEMAVGGAGTPPKVGMHASEQHKKVNFTRVPVSKRHSTVGPLGFDPSERLRPPLHEPPQRLLSPALRAHPKGCKTPLLAGRPHSPASSAVGNSLQDMSSHKTAALSSVGVAATPASAASMSCVGRATTLVGEQATEAHRENASALLMEANVCAMFSGSTYAGVREPTELHVLRALPVARTFLGHVAVGVAPLSVAVSPLATTRTSPGWAGASCVPRSAPRQALAADSMCPSVTAAPHKQPLVPKAPPAGARPSPGALERGLNDYPRRSTESALTSLLATLVPGDKVEAVAAGFRAPLSRCSSSLCNLREEDAPMSFESPQPLRSGTISISASSDAANAKRDCAADTTTAVLGDVSSPPPPVACVTPKVAATATLPSQRRFQSSLAGEGHAELTATCTAMLPESKGGAVTGIEEAVVPALGRKPMQSLAPLSRMLLPPQRWQKAAFRFHSVLQRSEGLERGTPVSSYSPSMGINEERENGFPAVRNVEVSVVAEDYCGRGESQVGEQPILAMSLQQSADAVPVGNAPGRRRSCTATDKQCSHKSQPDKPPPVEPRREDNAVDLLASISSRRELWKGLQLPHPTAPGDISFDNAAGQTLHSVTSLTRRFGYETGMRHMNSDACFGTFISSANSIRSSCEDRPSSFHLGNTNKERSSPPATQAASACTASPNISSASMRCERGSRGTSVRGNCHRKRENRGGDWAVSSAASHRCGVSCGSVSHQTMSSSVSILSFAFESTSSTTPGGSAALRRSGAAVKAHSFLQARSLNSLATESINTVASQPSSEEAMHLDDWKESRKSPKGICSGSSDVSSLPSLALSNSERQAFWQEAPQHLFNAESPQWQENRRRSAAAAKQRTLVLLQLPNSPPPLNAVDEPERRRHQHQPQKCRSSQHQRRSTNTSGSPSHERQ
ncbi:hypothetical protein LSCM1_06444 [Leishmania martiniquensis]|uniref:Uncharacterized protein n=1 Tax=Leishmania martiniquensis TaxID=1580590 RepID=A0A836KVV7_9TRYP|nr:hypothetical protein LSCM1_06444 [Leishmania martiniquensis]